MFRSPRVSSPRETAQARHTRLKKENCLEDVRGVSLAKHRAALRHAKNLLEMSRYYEEARQLSHKLNVLGRSPWPQPRRFVVCSGGGPGSWNWRIAGPTKLVASLIGLSIELPHEQLQSLHQSRS